ncbi:MAG: hypothetical protein ACR2PG_19905 [Hyphomicrobiaceae bacterium]
MIWISVIFCSVVALTITASGRSAGVEMAYLNMAVAAVTAVAFVVLSIRQLTPTREPDGPSSAATVAARTARYMSYVWGWGAIGLGAIYGTGLLVWKEWWHFLIAFAVAGLLCYYSSQRLQRSADNGVDEPNLLRQGRTATIVQLVGMVLVVVGLLVDGKMVRFMVERYTDWAANNIFFFGAAAIAAISVYALATQSKAQTKTQT